jgi:hypothetical protein
MRRSLLFWSLMNFSCLHQVKFGILDTLELGGQSFQQVRALFSAKDTALDLSEYTAGVVCGDLLAEYLVILDYGSRKLALVDIHEVMEM